MWCLVDDDTNEVIVAGSWNKVNKTDQDLNWWHHTSFVFLNI